jgi:hypothetical protein
MAHDIHEREREGIPILDFKGRIAAGPEATALREKVRRRPLLASAIWYSTWRV